MNRHARQRRDRKARLDSLTEMERIAGYAPGERMAEIRSKPFEPLPGDTSESFDYCLYCNARYTASTFFPYCSPDCARLVETENQAD